MSDQFFGAPTGGMGDASISQLKNGFASITDRSVESMAQTDRVAPRQVSTGNMRGTQRINNTDGSYLTIGEIPESNGEFGIAYFSADGTVISKSTAETQYFYDKDSGKNIIQIGKLPDDSYGWAVAKEGYDVEDAFTS